MIEIPSLRPETRYGMPPADQLLFNRGYIIGYSYLLRQAKWAMEVIDPDNRPILVNRSDVFRADPQLKELAATLGLEARGRSAELLSDNPRMAEPLVKLRGPEESS